MGFESEIYSKAFEIKKRDRYNAQLNYERFSKEIYAANPRLAEIDRKFGSASVKLALATFSKNGSDISKLKKTIDALNAERKAILGNLDLSEVQYSCKKCNDTGYVEGKICDCVEDIARRIAYEQLSEEMPIADCRFDNFDLNFYKNTTAAGQTSPKKRMTQILRICREYALNFKKEKSNLLFLGGTGLGKTHLSLAIANEVLGSAKSVIYGSAQNLLNKAAAEQFSYKGVTTVIDGLLCCDLLIIDDLGTEMSTSFTQSCIYNVINTRLLKNLSTIISTNLTLEEIEKRYTPRVSSRIIGNYQLLQFLGDDVRQQKAIAALKN